MKAMIIALALVITGCSSNSGGTHRYCSAADVNNPLWFDKIKDTQIVTKFGVEHTREAERDVVRMAQIMLAHQLYSRVSGSTVIVNGRAETTQYSKVASNVYLDSAKVEWSKENGCLIVWSGITIEAAKRSLDASEIINERERLNWNRIRNTNTVALLEEHIQMYPLGIYRDVAEERVVALHSDKTREKIRDSRLPEGAKLILNGLSSLF